MQHSITLIPLRLVTETQGQRNWRTTYVRRKSQRRTTYAWLTHLLGCAPPLPLTVTLTRVAPRPLDSDNVVSSFKAVQDGVADWIDGTPLLRKGVGGGQDRQEGLMWRYQQRKGKPREYAVEIVVDIS